MTTLIKSYTFKKVEGFADFADYYAIIDSSTGVEEYLYILQFIEDTQQENTYLIRGFLNVNDDLMFFKDYWYSMDNSIDEICMYVSMAMDKELDLLNNMIDEYKKTRLTNKK